MITLLPHQIEAVEAFRTRGGKMLLSASPGVGKTFCCAEIMKRLWVVDPMNKILILCPAAVKQQWRDELKKYFGYYPAHVWIHNYEELLSKGTAPTLLSVEWTMICADECHRLNNPKSKMVKVFHKLKARYRLAMSGTIFPNGLYECYSVLSWLGAPLGRTYWHFIQEHCLTHYMFKSKITGYRDEKKLMTLIAPYIHTIDKSVLNLPPKQVIYEWVNLSAPERELYDRVKQEMQITFDGSKLTIPNIVSLIVRLRQLVDCPAVLDGSDTKSSKEMVLQDLLLRDKQRTIVFSEFSTVAKRLHAEHGGWIITGDMSLERRTRELDGFKQDALMRPLFGTSAMATGLNIQSATRCIHFNLPWTSARVEQRVGRSHRQGQTEVVTEIYLLAKDTVDEKILKIVQAKGELDKRFTKEELASLLI